MLRGVYDRPDDKSNGTNKFVRSLADVGIEGDWPVGYNPRDDATLGQSFSGSKSKLATRHNKGRAPW